ncbi:hypothetical protein CXB51_023558 [Gossypium anomalum]|uniref:Retrotransposon gag domain-containing protein n=1 Tax=Gossypium anomalum TaxID=47600 RepID=A0A8J6CQD6_9ROSI|nr:hypothetical protein CXB51_023558 [Gossypium anomalum]
METCNNVKTDGDLMVKQLVQSLKGNAFNWYAYLDLRTIYSWEQLECEFFNKFYNTHRIVSMIELIGARQWKTFKKLATRADDMELSMTIAKNLKPFIQEPKGAKRS